MRARDQEPGQHQIHASRPEAAEHSLLTWVHLARPGAHGMLTCNDAKTTVLGAADAAQPWPARCTTCFSHQFLTWPREGDTGSGVLAQCGQVWMSALRVVEKLPCPTASWHYPHMWKLPGNKGQSPSGQRARLQFNREPRKLRAVCPVLGPAACPSQGTGVGAVTCQTLGAAAKAAGLLALEGAPGARESSLPIRRGIQGTGRAWSHLFTQLAPQDPLQPGQGVGAYTCRSLGATWLSLVPLALCLTTPK